MKNPNQFKDTPAVHRGFWAIVAVSGVLLTISLLMLWTNRHRNSVGGRQPEVSAAAPAENAWGVVPGTGEQPAPVVAIQVTNPVVEVAAVEMSGVVVHDVGASVKMMPAAKVQPVVVPESSVRKSP